MKQLWFLSLRTLRDFVKREEGQDLVEYALVLALVACGAIAGMKTLSTEINSAFNSISGTIATTMAGTGSNGGGSTGATSGN